jgi:lipopolysaccharide transport system permease protein
MWRITLTELRSRYAGSFLGLAWAVLTPALILAVYATVYLAIFRVRVPGLSQVGYVLYIFAGLVPYLAMAEALSVGVGSVIANKAVLANTVFPIDLAPAKAVLTSQTSMAVGLTAIIAGLAYAGLLRWTVFLVLPLWGLQFLSLVGLTWILSLLSVVLRDLQYVIGTVLMILLVASPMAYTPAMVPESLRFVLTVNPFAYFVTCYQSALVLGKVPPTIDMVVVASLSILVFVLGGWFFARTKSVLIDYV